MRILGGFNDSFYKRKDQDAYQVVWHKEAKADWNEWNYFVSHQQRSISGVWTVTDFLEVKQTPLNHVWVILICGISALFILEYYLLYGEIGIGY